MSKYKSRVLKDMVNDALEYLSEEKIAEVFDFVEYLLAKEKRAKRDEEMELDPKKDPILKYTEGVSVEPLAHRIYEILYAGQDGHFTRMGMGFQKITWGMETMDGKSLDITEEKRNMLKEIIPEAFTEDKIDWEKLKATLGEDVEFKNERYVLNWAGKSDAFRVCLVNGGEIALMLERVNESFIKKVIAENPNKVITLDRLFNNDDQLKTNTALQMKDAGVEFKVV